MKIKLLLLVIITTVWFSTQLSLAQDVFPKSDAIWVIHLYEYADRPGKQHIYGLSGDTIINNLTYQNLYLLNDSTLNIDHEDVYVAGIRQIDKQVLILPADKKDGSKFDEFLMYDFGKNVGEEINFGKKPPMGYDGLGPTFEKVDIEWLTPNIVGIIEAVKNTDMGKLFYVSGDKWIEKIGSLSGLFFYPLQFPSGKGGPIGAQLICMKSNNKIKYLDSSCESCFNEEPLSVSSQEINTSVSVIYNNSSNTFDINGEPIPFVFKLISIDGYVILTQLISEKSTIVDADNIPKGIYIYNIIGENITQSGKLIIK